MASPCYSFQAKQASWEGCDVQDVYVDVKNLAALAADVKLPQLLDGRACRGLGILTLGCLSFGVCVNAAFARGFGHIFLIASLLATPLLLRGAPRIIGAIFTPPKPAARTRILRQPIGSPSPNKSTAMKALVVYNPTSGARSAKVAAEARKRLSAAKIEFDVFETQYVGHARQVACSLSDHTVVVVVGGDGTVHEVVNGLHCHPAMPIAIVPAGTGNALCTSLMQARLPSGCEGEGAGPVAAPEQNKEDPMDWALRQLTTGSIVSIDQLSIQIGERRLDGAALAFFGLFAEVDIVAEPLRCLGPLRIDIAAVCQVLKLHTLNPTQIDVVLQDGSLRTLEDSYLAVFVGNSQYWTDRMRAVPNAVLDDGLLELMVIKPTSRANLIRAFLMLDSGAHVNDPNSAEFIETLKVRSAIFTFWDSNHLKPTAGVLNVDGEIFRHDGSVRIGIAYQSRPVYAGA
eukprot:TRINITY_DN56536_c0_g1_i1.p1 TRINITY_DN56536_c0_g1~~TRINITY_DN56536_c0_g1_i1.p1  ORF type:complete len:477 (+),score=66.00 TRINITY_DN56536_c0_g1_i1:60-1433(+)